MAASAPSAPLEPSAPAIPISAPIYHRPSADAYDRDPYTYEQEPLLYSREAFVREEVRVKKVVEHDTIIAEEPLRREELEVNIEAVDG